VLAGFAFAALIYVLTNMQGRLAAPANDDREGRSQQNHIVVSLICAFLGLVVTTFLYAVLGAEQNAALVQGRASSEELLSGAAFAFSVMSLLYSITLLIAAVGLKATANEVRAIVAVLIPPLAVMFLGFAAQDGAFAEIVATKDKLGNCEDSGFLDLVSSWAATVLPLVTFGICIALWILARTRLSVNAYVLPSTSRWYLRNALPKASLFVSLVAAVWSASWSEQEPNAKLGHAATWLWLVGSATILIGQAIYIFWSQPGDNLLATSAQIQGAASTGMAGAD
jgi:hypothetical protein